MKLPTSKTLLTAMVVVAATGVLLSTYSLLQHEGFASGSFCSINTTFDCNIVNKGPYSEIFNIPVALLGVIGYAFMALSAFLLRKDESNPHIKLFLGASIMGGLAFSLYLTGIEAFVLDTWCLLCLTSQALILSLAILFGIVFFQQKKIPPSISA